MTFPICLCGSQPGYAHAADCPRPLFQATDNQAEQWLADRKKLSQLSQSVSVTYTAYGQNTHAPSGN